MEKYLRPSEVARLLKLNTETIYHYIKKGDLPAARLGRKYIVKASDMESFIERRKGTQLIEKLNLSSKGKKMVEKVQANAERVTGFIEEYPGATQDEIAEALEMSDEDTERALHRLEGKDQAYREGVEDEKGSSEARWYSGSSS
jgi:excisionase family DNA binding protein